MNVLRLRNERAERLGRLQREFDIRSPGLNDPVHLIQHLRDPEEIELAAFIGSALAFGRIELFKPVIQRLLQLGGGELKTYLACFTPSRERPAFDGLYYRIWSKDDLICLFYALRQILTRYGSLKNLFIECAKREDDHFGPAISGFSDEFVRFNPAPVYGINQFTRSFKAFVPSPRNGSACKRFCLFLRWMIRKDGFDRGTWQELSPARLVVPLDVHIHRVGLFLKLTRRRTANWKTAIDITRSLREIDRDDPLKFDFPLCHFSIRGECLSRAKGKLCGLCDPFHQCYFGRIDRDLPR